MKQKLLFLLTALMLLSTGNAWGDETIGNVDQGWDVSGNKKEYTLAPGKALTINFTINETKNTEDYQGWVTQVLNGSDMVFLTQPNCGYWGSGWDKWYTGASYNGNTYNWDGTNFRENLQGASVNYIIQRVDNNIVLTEHVTTTSTAPNANVKMGHHFVFPYTSDADLKVVFGADAAVLTITDASISDADPLPTQYGTLVGDELNGTAWWTAFSDYYTLEPNETKSVYFKNYSCKISNGYNWLLGLTNNADRGGDGYTEYVILRSDHYGWASKYASGTITSNYDWNTFRDELDGADVKMTVARDAGTVTITATQIAATDGTTVRTETFTFTDNELASTTMRFFLTTEGGHLDIVDAYHNEVSSAGNGTAAITSTTFEDGYVNKGASVTVTATPDDGYRFVNWTEGGDVVSTNASYTYIALGNRNLVANFEVVPLIESITVNYTYNEEVVYSEAQSAIAGLHVGDSYNVPFRKYVMKGSTLYVSAKRGSNPWYGEPTTLTANTVVEKAVTPVDLGGGTVVLFEDLDNTTEQNAGIRASYCSAYDNRAYESAENLPAGIYDFIVYAQNKNRGSSVKVGETTVFTIADVTSTPGSWTETTISNVSVPAAGKMTFVAGGSSTYDDYDIIIAVLKSVPATIGSTGWTTFASAYPLNLNGMTASEGTVKAYYASSQSGNNIVMTSTDQTVAAGEGLMLKGTAGATVTIPVVASGDAISGNMLVGCTTETPVAASASCYVLVNNGGTAEFQSLEDNGATIPAGKAYLNTGVISPARLIISFEEDPTAINAVEAVDVEANGLKDGKYIIDNKVVIVKNGVKYGANGQKLN